MSWDRRVLERNLGNEQNWRICQSCPASSRREGLTRREESQGLVDGGQRVGEGGVVVVGGRAIAERGVRFIVERLLMLGVQRQKGKDESQRVCRRF